MSTFQRRWTGSMHSPYLWWLTISPLGTGMNTFARKSNNLVLLECKEPITTYISMPRIVEHFIWISQSLPCKKCPVSKIEALSHLSFRHEAKRVSRLEISILTLTITVSPHSQTASIPPEPRTCLLLTCLSDSKCGMPQKMAQGVRASLVILTWAKAYLWISLINTGMSNWVCSSNHFNGQRARAGHEPGGLNSHTHKVLYVTLYHKACFLAARPPSTGAHHVKSDLYWCWGFFWQPVGVSKQKLPLSLWFGQRVCLDVASVK